MTLAFEVADSPADAEVVERDLELTDEEKVILGRLKKQLVQARIDLPAQFGKLACGHVTGIGSI